MNMGQRLAAIFVSLPLSFVLAACGEKKVEYSAGYLEACHGDPLTTVEEREQAMQDGYEIRPGYNCIDKASFAAVAAAKAQWEADNTPEAKAQRKAEEAERQARFAAERARAAAVAEPEPPPPNIVLRMVDVNTATQDEIDAVISISSDTAAQIVERRKQRRFRDWDDLIGRVDSFAAAKLALYASLCGLTVDGKSLEGAPPNRELATSIHLEYEERERIAKKYSQH